MSTNSDKNHAKPKRIGPLWSCRMTRQDERRDSFVKPCSCQTSLFVLLLHRHSRDREGQQTGCIHANAHEGFYRLIVQTSPEIAMEETLIGKASFNTGFRRAEAKNCDGNLRQNRHMQSQPLPKWDWRWQRSGNDCQGSVPCHPLADLTFQLYENFIPVPKLFEQRDSIGGQSGIQFVTVRGRPRGQICLRMKSAG